jgi:hypothetical protein
MNIDIDKLKAARTKADRAAGAAQAARDALRELGITTKAQAEARLAELEAQVRADEQKLADAYASWVREYGDLVK